MQLPAGEFGEHEFGWQTERYRDFWSKLNWCAIMLRDKKKQEKYDTPDEQLAECIKKPWFRSDRMADLFGKVCADIGLNFKIREIKPDFYSDDCGYIDHQSGVGEEPDNARMFMSEKTLRDFLLNEDSYIDNSNDNGGRDDDEYDWNLHRYSSQPPDYWTSKNNGSAEQN